MNMNCGLRRIISGYLYVLASLSPGMVTLLRITYEYGRNLGSILRGGEGT